MSRGCLEGEFKIDITARHLGVKSAAYVTIKSEYKCAVKAKRGNICTYINE